MLSQFYNEPRRFDFFLVLMTGLLLVLSMIRTLSC